MSPEFSFNPEKPLTFSTRGYEKALKSLNPLKAQIDEADRAKKKDEQGGKRGLPE